jgi:hypothetical protein
LDVTAAPAQAEIPPAIRIRIKMERAREGFVDIAHIARYPNNRLVGVGNCILAGGISKFRVISPKGQIPQIRIVRETNRIISPIKRRYLGENMWQLYIRQERNQVYDLTYLPWFSV